MKHVFESGDLQEMLAAGGDVEQMEVAATAAQADELRDEDADAAAVDEGEVGHVEHELQPAFVDDRGDPIAELVDAIFKYQASAEVEDRHVADAPLRHGHRADYTAVA